MIKKNIKELDMGINSRQLIFLWCILRIAGVLRVNFGEMQKYLNSPGWSIPVSSTAVRRARAAGH